MSEHTITMVSGLNFKKLCVWLLGLVWFGCSMSVSQTDTAELPKCGGDMERKRHVHHTSKKRGKTSRVDEEHRYPAVRETRKFAQVYLKRADVQEAIDYLETTYDRTIPPPRYMRCTDKNGKKTKVRRYAHLLWRKKPRYYLRLEKEPVITITQDGQAVNLKHLSDAEKASIVKHIHKGTIPAADSPEYVYWNSPGYTRDVHSVYRVIIKEREGGGDVKVSDDERKSI